MGTRQKMIKDRQKKLKKGKKDKKTVSEKMVDVIRENIKKLQVYDPPPLKVYDLSTRTYIQYF